MRDLESFIKRSMEMFKEFDNRAIHNETQRKYFKTAKGKLCISKGSRKRRSLIIKSFENVSKEEKLLIAEFYLNCPEGHEVDHIIPVSKGGKHCMENLQYLTKLENRRKSDKLDYVRI